MAVVKIDKATKDKLEAAGITVDNELALAIKNGDFAGLENIAYVYTVEKEYTKAMTLYQIAADKNNAKAVYNIGELYYQGLGVDRNYITAIEWFLKAYNLGYKEGVNGIIYSLIYLDSTPRSMELRKNVESVRDSNKDLTPAQQEKVKKAVLKDIEDYIKTKKEEASNKRKMAEKKEEDEESNKKFKAVEDKFKAVEDKFKLLEDKAKVWEDKANIIQQSNQNLMTLLEQERQIRNNEITLMKQKIEMLEKQ